MPKCVLVAEDDPDIVGLVRAVLEDEGFSTVWTVGSQTVEEARRRRPDVVLLDYQMSGMDGVRIAREMRADPRTACIPIVAMTAAGRVPVVCRDMGADGCLGKPFDLDDLHDCVRTALQTRRPGCVGLADAHH